MTRIATVFVATGLQGSSVVNALLADGTFTPRAVTTDARSDAARALVDRGCEVVEAKFDDREAIQRAVTGAECVFLVTLCWNEEVAEQTQGINVVEACESAGVKFIVFSTLPRLRDVSHGKYTKVSEFEDKASVQKYLETSPIPCASISPGSFMENITRGFLDCPFEKTDTGYVLNTHEPKGCVIIQTWVGRDMGRAVVALFTQYQTRLDEIDRKMFVLGSQRATTEEFAQGLARGLEKPVEVRRLAKTGDPAMDELYDATTEFDWSPRLTYPTSALKRSA
ncbi:NAD(P)-binding protein [Schizophyllum commune H4-8]|nr:NAD(P)-binding protein [Schizophyllum commune H4-8]KAI5886365.1 NAD(P)-binding protein [Schizophyllum commune H4-8]